MCSKDEIKSDLIETLGVNVVALFVAMLVNMLLFAVGLN